MGIEYSNILIESTLLLPPLEVNFLSLLRSFLDFVFLITPQFWGLLKLRKKVVCPTLYRMNTQHFSGPILLEPLTDLWKGIKERMDVGEEGVSDMFFKGLYQTKWMARTFGKNRAAQRREKETDLQESLATTQIQLEIDPQSITLQLVV